MIALKRLCRVIQHILPPPTTSQPSIVKKIRDAYRLVYECRLQIDKKNRYGIHAEIERRILSLLEESIRASLYHQSDKKLACIEHIRVSVSVVKHLVRLEYEMKIIPKKKYTALSMVLVEISKMALGWQRYIQKRYHNRDSA